MPIGKGIHGKATVMVNETNTASKLGSGSFAVFGTPALVALMERAAVNTLRPHLEEGQDSVGVLVNIKHVAATPLGKQVRAEAEITAVDGHKVIFSVKAFDAQEMVGEGTHERVLVDREKFMWKVAAKGA